MAHIFISYSHQDKEYVLDLQDILQKKKIESWIDGRIDYGDRWSKVIQEKLDSCDALIVICSENSYKSDWVQNEVLRAQRKNKPIFPLLLSGEPWLSIEATQYVDVKGGKLPPDKFYKQLGRAISSSINQPQSELIRTQDEISSDNLNKVFTIPSIYSQTSKSKSLFLSESEVIQMLKSRGYFDSFWNPFSEGQHEYQVVVSENTPLILDRSTNLLWQQYGSSKPCNITSSKEYIEKINSAKLGSYNNWRLPTLEEAMSLMESKKGETNLFINSCFNSTQNWIWTSDKMSQDHVWTANFGVGICTIAYPTNLPPFVRAVRKQTK